MAKLEASQSSGISIGKGAYLYPKNTIIAIENLSNHPADGKPDTAKTRFSNSKLAELYLKVSIDSNGKESSLYVLGNYKVDKITGNIRGWDAYGNGVQSLLVAVLGQEKVEELLPDNYLLDKKLLDECYGGKFQRITYISGTYNDKVTNEVKASYKTLPQFFPVTATIEEIKAEWIKFANRSKSYTPDTIDYLKSLNTTPVEDTTFNYGANAVAESTEDNNPW